MFKLTIYSVKTFKLIALLESHDNIGSNWTRISAVAATMLRL